MKLITLTTDFGKQTQGIGNMEGVIYGINPDAKVIHLMHGLPGYEIFSAARTMETVYYMPAGVHVCVVDPGVGTERKALIVKVGRGDCFVGPDNGCLMTAPRLLGGIKKIIVIENPEYMLLPVSHVFHGRHVFAPAAAYISKGTAIEEFGPEIKERDCVRAPYEEAVANGNEIEARVIHVNHYGSAHLNILHEEWDKLGPGEKVVLKFGSNELAVPVASTYGNVPKGSPLILKDDYKRIEVAINMGSFAEIYGISTGESVIVKA